MNQNQIQGRPGNEPRKTSMRPDRAKESGDRIVAAEELSDDELQAIAGGPTAVEKKPKPGNF